MENIENIRYIAFLRGINVGGHRVKMDRLRQIFIDLGFVNVRSYINSGNIFFDTNEEGRQSMVSRIERQLQLELGYEVSAFLRTTDELEALLTQNPFQSITLTEDKRFCVVFTDEALNEGLSLPVRSSKNDMDLVAVNTYEAFVVWHIINGRPSSGIFPQGILPKRNTTRFFHTLNKILEAAQR